MSPIIEEVLGRLRKSPLLGQMESSLKDRATVEVESLSGSAFALYSAAAILRSVGTHIFLSADRDTAAYLYNDLYTLLGEERVLFFPSSYKRSIRYHQTDPSGLVERTTALEALRSGGKGPLVICTYPDAVAETVVSRTTIETTALKVKVGQTLSMNALEEAVQKLGFERVDFVYEPGQYAFRGGVFDLFSFADNKPYRVDLFGDSVESIRRFDISSQLSSERVESVDVLPDYKRSSEQNVSFAEYAAGADWWIEDLDSALAQIDDLRRKFLSESDSPAEDAALLTSAKAFLEQTADSAAVLRKSSVKRPSTAKVSFHTSPQPSFNKQYELLADDIALHASEHYAVYILSENRAQFERLENVLAATHRQAPFSPMMLTLHEGFVDHTLKACFYTDHQIFDRYHRYRLRGEIDRGQSLTVAELNNLQVGDYVVHIDHGVGRFGGLVHSVENGKRQESIKLVYRDGDVLLVNVHSLHRIARYKSKDSDTPPRVYKLGTGAWQRMKEATKSAVKNIARELIALYAERKASGGFRFSPDGYLQHELEGAFPYEETPDQQKAVELVKEDMESAEPMDRLVCGDVGFGKTEVAVRAAFKAVCDSKQVAVLVPTTILSLQHYRTFSERLRGMPVRIENLSRVRSTKEVNQILRDLADGKIDILVGTHKILGKDVKFKDLGLLIIDEEQKFGVTAKEKLRRMSVSVDTLTLTATPIPRTLQFSLMGARDLSVIATPPPNRRPIVTESHTFDEAVIKDAVDYELSRGGQVFFVHNKVEDIERRAGLVQRLCPDARVMVAHGQMPAQKTEKLIMDFIYGEYDVLVATTIIENGIDIPNANTIIIDDAQNFGLSDLHQLRGRVGRSDRKSFCYLLSPPDELLTSEARRRLRAIEEFSDLGSGFNIAMQDLDIRGAGNLLGAEQSGFIADMGFETYQKILSEAVAELRAEGVKGVDEIAPKEDSSATSDTSAAPTEEQEVTYISDCQIDTDSEAMLPDEYIGNANEKLRLYRQLDSTTDEREMSRLVAEMTDRFGALPEAAQNLVDVIRLRWRCIALGFEKAKIKNGLMLLWFPADLHSAYYKSPMFARILHYISTDGAKFVLKQNNNRPSLLVRDIKNLRAGWQLLDRLETKE